MHHYDCRPVGRLGLAASLLVLALGCDATELVEPVDDPAPTAASGANVKAPSNLAAVLRSDRRVDVSWADNSSNESGFEVYVSSTGATGDFSVEVHLGAGVTAYQDVSVADGTEYCYKVRASRLSGSRFSPTISYSAFSNVACVTIPISAASDLNAAPAGSTVVGMSWVDNSTGEAGFRVERSLDGGATWVTAQTVTGYPFWYDAGLTGDQGVCYRVITFGGTAEASPSNTDCTTPPLGPTNLTATSMSEVWFEIELAWSDNSAVEDGYEVWVMYPYEYYGGGGYWMVLDQLPANTTRYTVWGSGSYMVVAKKDGGHSDFSNEVAVP